MYIRLFLTAMAVCFASASPPIDANDNPSIAPRDWSPAGSSLNSTYTLCSQFFCFTQAKQNPGFSGCKQAPPTRQGNLTNAAGVTCVFWQTDNCDGSPWDKAKVWTLDKPGNWKISSDTWTTRSLNCMLQTDWDSAKAAGAMQSSGVLPSQYTGGVANIPSFA